MNVGNIAEREKIFIAFRKLHLFTGVPDDVLAVFYIASEEKIFRAGQIIVKEGEHGDELYIIGSGSVDVIVGHNTPNQTVVASLQTTDFFGEMCVIEPFVRSATVVARESTLLYALKSNCLNKVYQVWPEQQSIIMANLAGVLAHRIDALDPFFKDRAY